jgi:hypothetical protein
MMKAVSYAAAILTVCLLATATDVEALEGSENPAAAKGMGASQAAIVTLILLWPASCSAVRRCWIVAGSLLCETEAFLWYRLLVSCRDEGGKIVELEIDDGA